MTRSQKKIVAILTLIAAVLVIGAGYFAFQKYQAFAQQREIFPYFADRSA